MPPFLVLVANAKGTLNCRLDAMPAIVTVTYVSWATRSFLRGARVNREYADHWSDPRFAPLLDGWS